MRNTPARKRVPTPMVLLLGLLCQTLCLGAGAADKSSSVTSGGTIPEVISIPENASELEWLAASEVRRYVYLRTGKLVDVRKGSVNGDRVVVFTKTSAMPSGSGENPAPQAFLLKTTDEGNDRVWWIIGGDPAGTLYGAYRFAEKLGVTFGLDEDVIPDDLLTGGLPLVNETGKPRFGLRGLQPFHDFSVGPDWWNLHDYHSVLSQMAKLRMNFIGFHTYPSWNPAAGPEANVWIGLPEDVDNQGNVRFGYESGVVTTRRGWEVRPYPTSRYASGASLLFEADDYGPDFMLESLDWPKTSEDSAAMFNKYGDLQASAFAHARRLGIKTCVGTEVPLGLPKKLASRLEENGMKPEDPTVIRRLYEGTFLRLMRKMPVDYYWLWTPEIWLGAEPGCAGWEITTRENVERDLGLVQEAAETVRVPFKFATSGWRLGTRDDGLWMHKRTPTDWVASSINTGLGGDPVEKHYGAMPSRPKWVIGWAEDDNTAGAHCCTCWDLQLWVKRMFSNADEAFGYRCEGMMAIHWRTAAISPNIMALAQAGWEFSTRDDSEKNIGSAGAQVGPSQEFWEKWGRATFGGDSGAEAGRLLERFDGSHPAINALIANGAKTTEESISEFFVPLRRLEHLRPRIQGRGNLERFDYWLNLIHATELRVRIWVISARLTEKIREAQNISETEKKQELVRNTILPLRLELARSYEKVIGAFVTCAKSPGEVGTISSIESGMRERIVSGQDATIVQLLGSSLPAEAAIRSDYPGSPKIFVSAKSSHMKVGERQQIRAFVLSGPKSESLNLHWRSLGEGAFRKVPAAHRSRQAFRVDLPPQSKTTLEYYLEAVLADGQKILWPVTAPSQNQTVIAW